MAKLYPPYVEGNLPAQSGTDLCIPFRLNRAVSILDIHHIIARIKTVSTSLWKGTIPVISDKLTDSINAGTRRFYPDTKTQLYYTTIPLVDTENNEWNIELIPGLYYKIQLAFYNLVTGLGYYSSVGIFKYTTQPTVSILDLSQDLKNANLYTYVGCYNLILGDATEKVYSYRFDLRDALTSALLSTSGDVIHDSTTDLESYESRDTYTLEYELAMGRLYSLLYSILTLNGLKASSPAYTILRTDTVFPELEGTLIAHNNYDNGCVEIYLKNSEVNKPSAKNRGFIISRSSNKDNYQTWYDTILFTVDAYSAFPTLLGTDYTVELGVTYKYSIQLYQNSGIRTARMETAEPVIADFEDSFLYDGKRLFKIRYNAKVTSFKPTILETKLDTIGGKYPFIFRNGRVEYKEFPISGLVSYLADPDELFMSDKELGFNLYDAARDGTPSSIDMSLVRVRSTLVDTTNLLAERNFKMKALEWLTNGEPKLFRSPGEGNYIVRLMNVSLAPNDTVGRMLHTVSATAYEIADYTMVNLKSYGFLQDAEYDNLYIHYYTQALEGLDGLTIYFSSSGGAVKATLREVPRGTKVRLNFYNGKGDEDIIVGITGTYLINIFDYPLMSIGFISTTTGNKLSGYLDYGTRVPEKVEDFNKIRNVVYRDKSYQHIGQSDNIINTLTDIKFKPGFFYYLRIEKRLIREVYSKNDGKYYVDKDCTSEIGELYRDNIYHVNTNGSYSYYDPLNGMVWNDAPSCKYYFACNGNNEAVFDLAGPGYIILSSIDSVEKLVLDAGLMCDFLYQLTEYIYGIEEDNETLKSYKTVWELAAQALSDAENNPDQMPWDIEGLRQTERLKYLTFITELTRLLRG